MGLTYTRFWEILSETLSPRFKKEAAVLLLRVLLVDDNPTLLSLLGRRLASFFDVTMASSPTAAIAELESKPFDAIVSDDAMPPERNGRSLLREVAHRWPTVARLLTSGDAIEEEGDWHAFLRKPCEAAVLVATIHVACISAAERPPPL